MEPTTAAIVTASDGVAHGAREDTSAVAVEDLLTGAGFTVVAREVVPDERDQIAAVLRALADDRRVGLVVVSGGTGFGPRDVTPEATEDVIDRRAPGLAEAMRAKGRTKTPMADLSRATAGVRGSTLIIDVPGSPRGATESLEAVLGLLPHALQLLAGDTAQHPPGHGSDAAPTATAAATGADPSGHDHGRQDHGHDGGDADRADDDTHLDQAHAVHGHRHDEECALAHGDGEVERLWTLATVNASPVALYLLHWGRELGYRTVLVEPDAGRVTSEHRTHADHVIASLTELDIDDDTDIVATDHDRDGLADHLADALRSGARWIGLMGSPRHTPPHIDPLRERGFGEDEIARIQRPIGLNIGSKTPPEIALATLAGLIADRQGRDGGFYAAD